MKILRVRFFNLNSLRGEHEVDFDRSPLPSTRNVGLISVLDDLGLRVSNQCR